MLAAIAQVMPQRIVYVSCNPASLARDLAYLEQNGYQAEVAQPVDMFPMTHHVETVVLMTIVKNKIMEPSCQALQFTQSRAMD
ncbi:MAG: hypothetical protein ACLRXQ_08150 [Phascolarctobacterium faecium]